MDTLPQFCHLASYYLMRSLPGISVRLYGEEQLVQSPCHSGLYHDAEFRNQKYAVEIGRGIVQLL